MTTGRTLQGAAGGALAGAVVAVVVFSPSLFSGWTSFWLVAAFLGALAPGVLVGALLAGPPAAPAPWLPPVTDGWWGNGSPRLPPPPGSHPTGPLADNPVAETVRLVVPIESTGTTWWDQGSPGGRTGPAPRATPPRTARELVAYREAGRVVQCPRCGAFRVDVAEHRAGYAFRCRVDDHEWQWRPGAPWPETVVAAHRRPR